MILNKKRGFGLVFVIVMALVVGILSFSFISISRESNFMDVNVHEKIQAKDLVESAISYLKTELDDDLNYPVIKSQLPDMAEDATILDISGDNSGLLKINSTILKTDDTRHFETFSKLYKKNREFLQWGDKKFYLKELKCWIEDFENYPVVTDFESNYGKEKKGYFVIKATGMVDEHELTLSAKKRFSIFNSKLPVLSHFTLYVREHHNKNTKYNPFQRCTYFKDKNRIWDQSNNYGLVLQNYQYEDRAKPFKWGWVFMGNGNKYNPSGGDSAANPNSSIIHIDATNGELGGVTYRVDGKGDIRPTRSVPLISDMFQLMTPRFYYYSDLASIPSGAKWSGDVPPYGQPKNTHVKTTEGFYQLLKKTYDPTSTINPAELFGLLNVGKMSYGDFMNSFVSGFSKNPVTLGYMLDQQTFGNSSDAAKFEEVIDVLIDFVQQIFTKNITNYDKYYKSGTHLFGQFAWKGDKPHNTPTFVFGNVYSRFIQYGVFSNLEPNSTQYTFAINILKGILDMRNGTSEYDAGLSEKMFFVVCLPDNKSTLPVVMGFNLPIIEKIFFDVVKKIIGSFFMKVIGKDDILQMAIEILEGATPQQSMANNTQLTTMTHPVTGLPLTTAEVNNLNSSVGGFSSSSALDIDMIYNIARKYNFQILKVYTGMTWSQIVSKPYVECLTDIYNNNSKYEIFKSKIVMQPYNKNFHQVFEQNWWEWQTVIYQLRSEVNSVLGTDFILDGLGSDYNRVIDENFLKNDPTRKEVNDPETDNDEVKLADSAKFSELDFAQWARNRITHKILGGNVTADQRWNMLVRFLSPVGSNNSDSPGEFSLNKVVQLSGDINIGGGEPVGIKRGGILVVYGDIYIKNTITKNYPEEVLYLVAMENPQTKLGGNIIIETPGKIEAVLVAYDGIVKSKEKVNIRGMLSCKNLNVGPGGLKSIEKGGVIRFDPAIRKDNYRVVISSEYEQWDEK